jgi:hypothetical protein
MGTNIRLLYLIAHKRSIPLLLEWHSLVEVKVKVVPVLFPLTERHPMKAYWGSGGIAPRIL